MMRKQVVRFRRLAEEHFGGRPGPGDRYPETLRVLAVEVASRQLAEGRRLAAVAEELGVRPVTLQRWVEGLSVPVSLLRAVDIVREGEAHVESFASSGHLTLVTVSGHRIEGLELAEVALLLESLA